MMAPASCSGIHGTGVRWGLVILGHCRGSESPEVLQIQNRAPGPECPPEFIPISNVTEAETKPAERPILRCDFPRA